MAPAAIEGLNTMTFGPKAGFACCAITNPPAQVRALSIHPNPASLRTIMTAILWGRNNNGIENKR
jgi:hypothetical protein